ncbi:MAG: YicC/YloC family endoribonuclease [Oscillospiraceae bacterium]
MTLIKSMTGYGRAVKTLLGREFTVELRAVNNRYLDCTVKLPRSLTFAEEGVKQRVKAAVARGKVDVLISVGAAAGEPVQVSLNRPVLEGYLQAMNAMVQEYGVHNDISAAALARLPEVFLVEKPKEDEDELLSALLQVVDEALAAFNAMRAAEGAAMEADLQSRGQTILNLVAQVEAGSPQTVADYRARLEAKMQEVLERTAIDESRILQEAAMFADKVAVDEETVRLRSHLSQMQAMLSGGGAIGRKLDFLLQEMNREANTIGSKCTDLALARVVVEIKAELEKIREQAQNIE